MSKITLPKKAPNAILTGDWHIRETKPLCRVDDFEKTLWRKIRFISKVQKKYGCPVLHSGDLFHHWKPSPYLIAKTIKNLPKQFYSVYGNHDLPDNTMEQKHKSGLYAVASGKGLTEIEYGNWDDLDKEPTYLDIGGRKVLVMHIYVTNDKKFWNTEDQKAHLLFKKYPEADLILTGDNHIPFVLKTKTGRLLVNPGPITRQDASQVDYKPRIYLYYADENKVIPLPIPIDKDAVTDEHIRSKQLKDAKSEAFVNSLNTEWSGEASFETNLKKFEIANSDKVPKEVFNIIYKALE